MITLRDAVPAAAAAMPRAAPARAQAPLAQRLLHFVLFVTIFTSSFALIEPSPHDVLMGLLAVCCLAARVSMSRYLLPLLLLLVVWNIGGLVAIFGATGAEQYAATSVYLAIAAVLFACLLSDDTVRRLQTLRRALILTAVMAAALGVIGYFRLVPGELFTLYGRASSTFKDPNVFAPFLILPLLFVIEPMMTRGIRLHQAAAVVIMLAGLMLAFSRGAWFHFVVSAAVMVALLIMTAPSRVARVRLIALSVVALFVVLLLVVALLSIPGVADMLQTRAQVVQSYDVGEGGRFRLQELALSALLDWPLGVGPFEFARRYGLQQHNVYLQSFIVYGWVGGIAYVTLVIATIGLGLRIALLRTPWQPALIVAVAVFIGEALEGFIIDTDHWRHFFLVLGIVWGLSAATLKMRHTQTQQRR